MKKLQNLVISCGGTGGHFHPGLSIARIFQAQGGKVLLLLGGKHADDQIKTASGFGISAKKVTASPPLKTPAGAYRFFRDLAIGYFQCKALFRTFQPQAFLSMGSFASLPPTLAAKSEGIPMFLHDGNARIGKSNRFLSRLAAGACLSFPAVNQDTMKCFCTLTGLPLRPELRTAPQTKAEAIQLLNEKFHVSFDPEKPVLLVFGGSLGAAAINDNFSIPADHPRASELQIIHLSGPGKFEAIKEKYKDMNERALVLESCPDMQILYPAADAVICRAGGSTVSELALFGKFALLIPYPFAMEHHQDDNARWLESEGGAEILSNDKCSPEAFQNFVSRFLDSPDLLHSAGQKSLKLAIPNAAERVLEMIEVTVFN